MVDSNIFDFQNSLTALRWPRQPLKEQTMTTTLKGQGQRALGNVPPLADLSDRVLFGEVWERDALNKRDRSLVTVACLVALCRDGQLPFHLQTALDNGVTREELDEVVTHLAF